MKQTPPQITKSILHLFLFVGVVLICGTIRLHSPVSVSSPESPSTSRPAALPTNKTASRPAPVKLTSASFTPRNQAAAVLSPKFQEIKQSVHKEYVYHMFATPNDPAYSSSWSLSKVNAPAAWSTSTGNGQTIVAVIDTGFALNHEDLINQWYTNSGETGMTKVGDRCWTGTPQDKSKNNCDDDNNGYVDDWRGWSFVNGDNNPQAGRLNSTGSGISHGTEVSGIVGATSNNDTGVAALDWNTKIMPLQVLDDDGTGYTSDVTAAVYYAVDSGAQVINMSLGAYANDPAMKAAVDYATANNVVVVAAAGNCGDGSDPSCSGVPVGTVAYPAAYPDVIAVGATTSTDQRASFSSYGPSLDVSAPGYAVPESTAWSATNPTSLYSGSLYGTSFASPMVASLTALIKSIRPSSSVADVTALIDATASKPVSMNGLMYSSQIGHGVIDAGAALSIASTLNTSGTATPALLQTGSYSSEHTTFANTFMTSGCQTAAGSACTIEFINGAGYKRFLPYSVVPVSGSTGWSWTSDMLDAANWQIRARRGDNLSTTPYNLFKKS